MISISEFAHELRKQLREAAANGADTIIITSGELCQSMRSGRALLDACCEAMQQEVQDGDLVVQDKNSGTGMAVRYRSAA